MFIWQNLLTTTINFDVASMPNCNLISLLQLCRLHAAHPKKNMMNIRELDQSKNIESLLECVVEIQGFERALVPSIPKGADICLEYTHVILQK